MSYDLVDLLVPVLQERQEGRSERTYTGHPVIRSFLQIINGRSADMMCSSGSMLMRMEILWLIRRRQRRWKVYLRNSIARKQIVKRKFQDILAVNLPRTLYYVSNFDLDKVYRYLNLRASLTLDFQYNLRRQMSLPKFTSVFGREQLLS